MQRSFSYELQPGKEGIVQEIGDMNGNSEMSTPNPEKKIVLHRAGKTVWNAFLQGTVDNRLHGLKKQLYMPMEAST